MLRSLLTISMLLFAVSLWSQNSSPDGELVSQGRRGSQSILRPITQDQRGTENAPLVIKQVPAPDAAEKAAQETEDRRQKATNDKELVDFTGLLALIGFFQLIVFGLQAWQLQRTVKAATQQSEAMERSIAEANRLAAAMENAAGDIAISAKAATESVSALRERTAQQMRAYICAAVGSGIYQERAQNIRFQGAPLIINTGHTPAHNVSVRTNAAILPIPLPNDYSFPLPATATGASVIGPQQNMVLSPMVSDFCDDADVEKIKRADGKALYAWGVVTYEDVFSRPQQTRFCQIITWLPGDKIWGYYTDRHNDAT